MIYLTGATNDRDEPFLIAAGIGLMANPGNGYHVRVDRYPWFAADNGCFGGQWVEDQHLSWLDALPRDRCLFAVAPDVYPDAAASLELGAGYFALIREMGYPVALVAQDGAEQLDLPWDDFDVLFLGGERNVEHPSREWKIGLAAEELAHRARGHGKWVHMGRVNSMRRMKRARAMGVNSADGTFIKYTRRPRARDTHAGERDTRGAVDIHAWGNWLRMNPTLPLTVHETPHHPVHREAVIREDA